LAKTDKEFAQQAITMNYLTAAQAEECLLIVVKAREMGLKETLPEVLIKKGYLNRAQEAAVNQVLNQPRLSHIGKYRLIARVGQGGMGTVYKAKQESLDKIVAVKVMAPSLARHRDFVERFIREAQASGRLNHPNVVLAIDAGEADGYYYFAMEFVDGENLKDVLTRDGKLSERRASTTSSTATSSPATSFSPRTARRSWATWAWRRRLAPTSPSPWPASPWAPPTISRPSRSAARKILTNERTSMPWAPPSSPW
jgi:hypothetical protein